MDQRPRVDWAIREVADWARNFVGDAANILHDQEIDGEVLLRISQEDLERLGMKYGPANKIIAAIKLPDPSEEYWQNLLQTLKTISIEKVKWNGESANDPNLSVLSLPTGFKWPTLESRHLFLRTRYNCYDKIWKDIETEYLKRLRQPDRVEYARALIQGNSGIGKTAFLNYVLVCALQQGYPVLLETKEERVFFQGDKVEREDIVMMEKQLKHHHRDPNVLVLHDHQPQSEPPIITNGAFVIAPVSPDARNSKQFRRELCLVRWMPLPTSQELEAMNSIEPQLSSEDLHARIDLFGPITRVCLSKTTGEYERYEEELKSKLQSFRFKELSPMLRAATLPTTQEHGLSWWIIHLDAQDTLDKVIVTWGSSQIFDRVTRITDSESLAELEDFIADRLRTPSPLIAPPTKEYEVWVAYKLAQGMDLRFRYYTPLDGNLEQSESHLPLSKAEVLKFKTYKFSLETLKNNPAKLLYSTNPKAVLCDIAALSEDTLILFQTTTGSTHSLNLDAFKEYANEAKKYEEVKKMILVYVVPDNVGFKVDPKDFGPSLDFIKNESSLDIKIAVAKMKPQSFDQIQFLSRNNNYLFFTV